MGSLVIPNQQQNPNPFLRFVLEQLTKGQVSTSWQRLRWFPYELNLVVNRPTNKVHHVMSLRDSVTDIFPAFLLPVHLPSFQWNLRYQTVGAMRVLVKPHGAPFPHRKVRVPHATVLRIGGDAAPVKQVVLNRREPHLDAKRGVRLRRLAGGSEYREPVGDFLARGDPLRRNLHAPHGLGAEDVVVLDAEF